MTALGRFLLRTTATIVIDFHRWRALVCSQEIDEDVFRTGARNDLLIV